MHTRAGVQLYTSCELGALSSITYVVEHLLKFSPSTPDKVITRTLKGRMD